MHAAVRIGPKGKGNDYLMIALMVLLITFGIALLASASSHLAETQTGDAFYYVKRQLMYGVGLGILGFFVASAAYYKRYERYAMLGMIFGICLLALTFTPLALEAKGAARWVKIGSVTFQPSEPLKLFFMIYLAAWLTGSKGRNRTRGGFIAFLMILGSVMGILIAQPATSTAFIIGAIAGIMYFASGSRLSHIFITLAIAGAIFAIAVYSTPYRRARIEAFLHPERTERTSGFQASQAQMAIGAGEMWGVGYGQSTTKLNYLPEPLGDSIFAIAGEELGFAGCIALMGLMLALVVRIFLVAIAMREQFGRLLLIGIGSLFAIQSFVNIGAISGLMPSTGISLPFISYGSTGLAVFMTMIGVANNIAKHSNA